MLITKTKKLILHNSNMDIKKKSKAHRKYIEILRSMTPEQRLLKAFELTELGKKLFTHGLRKRYPDLPEEEFKKLLRKRLDKCHNRTW